MQIISDQDNSAGMNRITVLLGALIILFITSCDIKKNKDVKPETFLKIYDHSDITSEYIPYDIQQTADEGFLILGGRKVAESPFKGVYVMKTDKDGNFVSEQNVPSDYVNPVNQLVKVGNQVFFFCMDRLSLEAKLMKIDEAGLASEVAGLGLLYPLSASLNGDNNSLTLLSYNREDKRTVVSRISTSGAILNQKSFDIGFGDFDAEQSIIEHLSGQGKHLPFFCGQLNNNTYYFNAFYRYTLSLVFFDMLSTDRTPRVGLVQGYQDERVISSLVFKGNGFAISRFAYGDNFFIPNVTLNYAPNAVSSSSDIPGNKMFELKPDANVVLKNCALNNGNTLVYGSDTKSGQIALYFYDVNSGMLLGNKYLGSMNPYTLAGYTVANDKSLVVAGTTWIAGRFPRICIFKVSKEELDEAM
ncbi:hypothetical protein [Sporocytophaga myxococcoides]|nr:hypothetical protein [Sporocytophaga myxococcoides]